MELYCPDSDRKKEVNLVSIPERVWGGLELVGAEMRRPRWLFQSLRGFGVGWSAGVQASGNQRPNVSIPERVWGGLEPEATATASALDYVSIPERVWGGLERP